VADDDLDPPEEDLLRVRPGVAIPLRELTWRFTTSSGPGGQHANKAATRAEVVFDPASSTALTASQRARISSRLGSPITVGADDSRSQSRNRDLALDRLRTRLADALHEEKPRRKSKPSKAAKRRRVDEKKQRGQTKKLRGRVHRDDG
jgi:ribosome-associated protein